MPGDSKRARFEREVLPHLDAAYNLARWLLRNGEDAADATQDACFRAYKYFDGFHGGDAKAWLLKIVRNSCYSWLKHNPKGEAFQEFFGKTSYTFDHKGVHFIALDNVSDPRATLGDAQIAWLEADLKQQKPDQPIVVLTHRPLFDLAPSWDWATRDGGKAIDLLMPFKNVVVFYGHIHQEHHQTTGHIAHHAAKGLMYPLPAPLSQPQKAPIPWDEAQPYRGLGFRDIEAEEKGKEIKITELAIGKA